MASPNRVLIVAFDGLRPDMVTPDLMPTLHAFAREGTHCVNSRAVFPSETRVNQASLVTGAWPARHGIVGNKFSEPDIDRGKLVDTGDEDQLRALDDALDGRLIDVPSLGEILAEQGRELAVVGSGTAGGTRMLHHAAARLGQFRLSLYRPDASVPGPEIQGAIAALGPIPEAEIPATARLTYATDVFIRHVWANRRPDATILWFFEPDISFHYRGVGSEDSRTALRHADGELKRLLEWRETAPEGGGLQIVTLSDHGHVSMAGDPIGLAKAMRAAGFPVGASFADGARVVLFCASSGGIYVKDSDPALIAEIRDWLCGQDWCGPLFTADGARALRIEDVGIAHRRAPDIALVARAGEAPNANGLPGSCRHDAGGLPPGCGIHGGLHPRELNTWLAFRGSAFGTGRRLEAPCGVIDVLPTILRCLGCAAPPSVAGRVLEDAFADAAASRDPLEDMGGEDPREIAVSPGLAYKLRRSVVAGRHYLQHGWADGAAA